MISFSLGLDQLLVDAHALHVALGGQRDRHHAAARGALDRDLVELGLHLLHLRLQLRRLLHQPEEISHRSPVIVAGAVVVGIGQRLIVAGRRHSVVRRDQSSRRRTPTISAPGKRASTACTSGSARTPCSSSLCFACVLRADRRRALFARDHHHPAAAGPLGNLAREIVDQRLARARLERDLELAVLDAHQPYVALQRASSSGCRASRWQARSVPERSRC